MTVTAMGYRFALAIFPDDVAVEGFDSGACAVAGNAFDIASACVAKKFGTL
jgi:hypothetical protein